MHTHVMLQLCAALFKGTVVPHLVVGVALPVCLPPHCLHCGEWTQSQPHGEDDHADLQPPYTPTVYTHMRQLEGQRDMYMYAHTQLMHESESLRVWVRKVG